MGLHNPNHYNMLNIRKRMLAEYGSKCFECGYVGYVEVHHIKPVMYGGLDGKDNLSLLCEVCHAKAHGQNKKVFIDPNRKYWKPQEKS